MSKKQEELIKEQRTIEATQKNLMGMNGKIALVAQVFGDEIMDTNIESFHYDGDLLPTIEEFTENVIGVYFEGLKFNANLQIKLDNESYICVTFEGHKVYEEETGELLRYVPLDAWEKKIDEFYEPARKKLAERIDKRNQEIISTNKKRKLDKLREYREKWGL
jgi:hypothetical protein